MIIAIPTNGQTLSQHFGRCRTYTFFDVDSEAGNIETERTEVPPAHQPGVLPAWIAEVGGSVVITGGMGPRAIQLFEQRGIQVVLGAPSVSPREAAEAFLAGNLQTGDSSCSHGDDEHGAGHHCR
ncbi:MAG: NifB/NifX family molybdenum-iron cluster-binding protein [Acidobacteriota bacterium]